MLRLPDPSTPKASAGVALVIPVNCAVEAVTVPRIHCEGLGIHTEATVSRSVIKELRALGHTVHQSAHSFDPTMSRAHVISTIDGRMRGGADPRGGAGVVYAR